MQNTDAISNMTAAELAIAERAAGMSIATFDDPNMPIVPLMGALAWVVKKRETPTLSYQAFMEASTIDEIQNVLGFDEDDEDAEGND